MRAPFAVSFQIPGCGCSTRPLLKGSSRASRTPGSRRWRGSDRLSETSSARRPGLSRGLHQPILDRGDGCLAVRMVNKCDQDIKSDTHAIPMCQTVEKSERYITEPKRKATFVKSRCPRRPLRAPKRTLSMLRPETAPIETLIPTRSCRAVCWLHRKQRD